jgi:hypothetical protein
MRFRIIRDTACRQGGRLGQIDIFAKQKCKLKNDRDVIFEQRQG